MKHETRSRSGIHLGEELGCRIPDIVSFTCYCLGEDVWKVRLSWDYCPKCLSIKEIKEASE